MKLAGAAYLLWLAWHAVRPGADPVFVPRRLAHDGPLRLYGMGLLTNLLNPKIAVLYLSLLPQFVVPWRGHLFGQSMVLGLTQIAVSLTVNSARAVVQSRSRGKPRLAQCSVPPSML